MIFRQIVFYALLVGALSGLVLTVAQTWQVVPIIQAAEEFEGEPVLTTAAEHPGHSAAFHEHAEHEHSAGEWAPEDGIERTAYTLLSNVLTAIGFALVIMVAMLASASYWRHGDHRLDWRHGLIWGGAGYAVFWLSPALGLPPEIPLAATAPLEARQLWWLFTVVCTAIGLAGLAFGKSPWRWAAPVLLLVPHLVGAPHPPGAMFGGQPPAVAAELEQLAQQFIGATAIANAALWLVLGLASAWAVRRIVSSSRTASPVEMKSHTV